MIRKLLILLIIVTALEIVGLVLVSQWIGLGYTFGLLLVTGLLGVWLAKKQGLQTIQLVQIQLARKEIPGQSLLDGVCILAGGIFLIAPGFLTDILGLLLLLPYTRNIVKAWLVSRLSKMVQSGQFFVIRRR
ncbi:FxsA family protein [Bacillus horti]|uniref:UPF0716 protein FxsA n=1 Tax=Caldalkalibacillus horti TaxID=77523 RepID=A0ABT9VT66_9BACI|nr:FxsA family protein [Bacillus horti]MDQ0164183.1 UPF0716 protein FxsA [Bacillus horti]